ncbi:MAG: cyclic nucleotide-binding domain-containing protein [Proteobacteria bacterium]|nr:cyclic nucleotide-binding domain-containing protein [Pseudomonadota bacterium]
MHWKVRRDFLARVEVFTNLSQRDLKALARSCSEATYPNGEALCNQGERGITAFLIVSGSVRIENALADGTVVEVAELKHGTMVGELSVVDGAERVATVRAIGEVQTLVLTQWSMIALLKSRPTIAAAMLPVIVKRFRETAEELRSRDRASKRSRNSIYQ